MMSKSVIGHTVYKYHSMYQTWFAFKVLHIVAVPLDQPMICAENGCAFEAFNGIESRYIKPQSNVKIFAPLVSPFRLFRPNEDLWVGY